MEKFQKFPFLRSFTQATSSRMFFGQRGRGGRKRAGTKQQQPGGMKKICKNGKTRPQNLDE
jgi:hypothetical protein